MKKKIHPEALRILRQACFLKGDSFMCFGKYFHFLHELNLIDSEYQVTFLGRKFIKHCVDEGAFDE